MNESATKRTAIALSLEAMEKIHNKLLTGDVQLISFGGTPEQVKRDDAGNYLVDLKLTVEVSIPKEVEK
ncbi:MAG: hypothetical protein M1469_01185 [Bacteroidetes bacterium]|nr:hypothetical protein [Bacteroidota bacterium]